METAIIVVTVICVFITPYIIYLYKIGLISRCFRHISLQFESLQRLFKTLGTPSAEHKSWSPVANWYRYYTDVENVRSTLLF